MAIEPTTASSAYIVVGVFGAMFGPLYGPLVLMAFAALIGALLALGNTKVESKFEGAVFLLVAVLLSLALTGTGVWVVERFTTLPGSLAIMPVAFSFAAARNLIIGFIAKLLDALVSIVSRKGGA